MKQKKKMTSTGFLLLITIVLFFVMYAAGMVIFADKGFAKPQMFLNLFVSNAGLLVISCGLTIVMITGGIDISVGSVTALVCMVMADLMENKGVSAYVAVLAALLIGLAFGIVQGFLVTYMGIQPFIVTLAGMFFGRGMTAIISTDMISIKNEVFLKWANYRFYMPFGSTNKKGKFIPAKLPNTLSGCPGTWLPMTGTMPIITPPSRSGWTRTARAGERKTTLTTITRESVYESDFYKNG